MRLFLIVRPDRDVRASVLARPDKSGPTPGHFEGLRPDIPVHHARTTVSGEREDSYVPARRLRRLRAAGTMRTRWGTASRCALADSKFQNEVALRLRFAALGLPPF